MLKLVSSRMSKVLCSGLILSSVSLSGCGYFMYPERVGQTGGKLDPAIVVLDALGLFVGVIPGVVAFAVDFTTGAIYLSPGEKSVLDKHKNRVSLNDFEQGAPVEGFMPVGELDLPANGTLIEARISEIVGQPVQLSDIQFYQPNGHRTLAVVEFGSHSFR